MSLTKERRPNRYPCSDCRFGFILREVFDILIDRFFYAIIFETGIKELVICFLYQ